MANIKYLHSRKLADGRYAWNWKPSPALRKGGWKNQQLGESAGKNPPLEILAAAIAINEQVDGWKIGGVGAIAVPALPDATRALPRKWLFSDLVDAYEASDEFKGTAPKTQKEYRSRLRQLRFWADDGKLPILDIDKDMVRDLKKALLGEDDSGNPGSKHKCAAMLRVLRLLMRWAGPDGQKLIPGDPTAGVPIPTPPSRTTKMTWEQVQAVAAIAREAGDEDSAFLLEIAFWSVQRRGDLLELNRLAWRTFEGLDPRDRPYLVDRAGDVRGFRLLPQKTRRTTGKWVDAPMPPFLHEQIAARFEKSQWLFHHPDDAAKPMPEHTAQRASASTSTPPGSSSTSCATCAAQECRGSRTWARANQTSSRSAATPSSASARSRTPTCRRTPPRLRSHRGSPAHP
ncbi:hypothetical protein [Novosphingobium sp. ST904]|uniref:tyrosine-type recombinase/integrase n=1 Tax=Novosphingobium sp. ST904 TaxID=1684385 RepID=UPI0006C83A0D|nr:hypothetical protein [Novosphingobium sp. ST904]KPH59159.1 hypothetical protein ADT71_23735 [Novosphingobium sp. ST904]